MNEKITIIDIALLLASAIVITTALVFLYFYINQKVYLTKYISPDTGVGYYITDSGIIPIYNPDGSLYYE